MHSVTHSLAHRAPPATRTRVRWQPYNSLPATVCPAASSSRTSPASYLNTPASSVSSSSPPNATPLCEIERLRQALPASTSQLPKEPPLRDATKNKYAVGLVDQAVKSLCEIWRPQDIPSVFVTPSRAMVNVGTTNDIRQTPQKQNTLRPLSRRNNQLPSPVSPSTHPSPSSDSSSTSSSPTSQALLESELDKTSFKTNLVPIKGFVHEVLRRSRTSGCVLQTALCYLEAIRCKVPELLRKERLGEGVHGEPLSDCRIMPATDAELAFEAELNFAAQTFTAPMQLNDDCMDTVRVTDVSPELSFASSGEFAPTCLQGRTSTDSIICVSGQLNQTQVLLGQQKPKPSPLLLPLPPLPSPLLCPRRAFLASLILASKFTQDKCYSNRAWAKLSGLPAREIGRCERALGEALEWRLWVGKTTVAQASPPQARPVVRSQSEGSLLSGPESRSHFLVRGHASSGQSSSSSPLSQGLRRCATMPAEINSSKQPSSDDQFFDSTGSKMSSSNVAELDQFMDVMGQPGYPCLITQSVEVLSRSPCPETPGLTYSPSSTESSSGDRTVQMPFLEDNMAPVAPMSFTSSLATESWPWLDASDQGNAVSFKMMVSSTKSTFGVSNILATQLELSQGKFGFRDTKAAVFGIQSAPIGAQAHPWRLEQSLAINQQ